MTDPTSSLDADVIERLARARLVALDVDGVLTDGRVTLAGEVEVQSFDVHDGQGLVWLRRAGVQVAWITGRGCESTARRASELGIEELHMRSGPKAEVLARVQAEHKIDPADTVAMGDDLPDFGLAERASVFVAPANARAEVRARADFTTTCRGGRGAVRELVEAILSAQGRWASIVDPAR